MYWVRLGIIECCISMDCFDGLSHILSFVILCLFFSSWTQSLLFYLLIVTVIDETWWLSVIWDMRRQNDWCAAGLNHLLLLTWTYAHKHTSIPSSLGMIMCEMVYHTWAPNDRHHVGTLSRDLTFDWPVAHHLSLDKYSWA